MGEARLDEVIDGVVDWGWDGGDRGNGRALNGLISPMTFVDGAFGNPAADGFFLRIGEGLLGVLGGHAAGGIGGEDALDDGAFVGVAGDDGGGAGRGGFQSFFAAIEAHAGHAGAFVGTMAAEAGIRHDGPDIAIEFDGFGAGGGGGEGEQGGDGKEALRVRHVEYVTTRRGGEGYGNPVWG